MSTTTLPIDVLVSRVLALAADFLDEHATITHPLVGLQVDRCMSDGYRDRAVTSVQGTVLDRVLDRRIRDAARAAVREALPPVAGTVAEYAARLRETAVAT